MPKQYEKIRDSYIKRGKSAKRAKQLAAMTWNKMHPSNPNPWMHETAMHKGMMKRTRKRSRR